MVYRLQGQQDKAIAEFDRALAINPRLVEALANRGVSLVFKGRLAEATADFDRTLEVDPNNSQAFVGRGVTMLATGQPERRHRGLRSGARH